MATVTSGPETIADLLSHLHVPPERILLRPFPGTATEDDVVRSQRLCELIDGVLVEKAMGYYESRLGLILAYFIERYLEDNPIGFALDGTGMIRVARAQVRLPDVSFFSWDHFPGKILPKLEQILGMVPDLAVEILSPGNTEMEMERKRREYFNGGAKLYWECNPPTRTVKVYTSFSRFKELDENGTLTGGKVLPGFSLAIKDWFVRAGERG